MALQRWDPVRDLLGLQENLNRLFEDALARSGSGPAEIALGTGWRPATDLFEEPERYVARLDLPGVLPADVTVEIEGDAVAIRGETSCDMIPACGVNCLTAALLSCAATTLR